MKKITALLLFIMVTAVAFAQAAQTPQEARTQIDESAQRALGIMGQAHKIASTATDRSKARQAIELYLQAGQLLEKVAQSYAQLVPSYATQEDVANATKAMQTCLDSIKQLQQRFA